jgi:hypothetical protein
MGLSGPWPCRSDFSGRPIRCFGYVVIWQVKGRERRARPQASICGEFVTCITFRSCLLYHLLSRDLIQFLPDAIR